MSADDAPLTRADLERLAEAIIGKISDLRQEMNNSFDRADQRFESLERRTERIETNIGAILMQTAGMSKSLTDAERIDSALAATQAAQQRAIDLLAQRAARLETQRPPQ